MSSAPGNTFLLQVDTNQGHHLRTLHNTWPRFTVSELQSGTTYKVNVRCENKHGRSDPLYLLVQTLNEPIKQIAETKLKEENSEQNELMAIIIGVVVSLVIMTVMLIIAGVTIRVKRRSGLTRSDSDSGVSRQSSSQSLTHSAQCTTISSDVAVSIKQSSLCRQVQQYLKN